MQFSIFINQSRAVEWALNSQQAMLFAFLYISPSWARAVEVDGVAYCYVSKSKVIDELPLLTDKPDTVYRLMKQLADMDLIRLTSRGHQTLVSITDKGALWNNSHPCEVVKGPPAVEKIVDQTSEKNPTSDENTADQPRKNIRPTSEKYPTNLGKISDQTSDFFPTYHITNNHITNHKKIHLVENPKTPPKNSYPDWFESLWKIYPPRVGANDKRKAFNAVRARLKNGKSVDQLVGALERYRVFCRSSGRWGSEYVMQAATFFGPGGHVDNPWEYSPPPTAGPGGLQSRPGGAGVRSTRERSLQDDLTDRSWATSR